jgi:hypothetical protein
MSFKIFWISLITIVFSFPSLCFSEKPDSKLWEYLGTTDLGDWYYNKKIITTSSNTLLVWFYTTVTNDTKEKRIEDVKKYDLDRSIKYQNYDHEVVLWEIDCKKRLWRVKDIIDFDKKQKVLDRYRYNDSEWDSIISNIKGERLYQKVCVIRKEPAKKK